MNNKTKSLFIFLLFLTVISYALSPILRRFYDHWKDSSDRKWRDKWYEQEELREAEATKRHATAKSLRASIPGSKGVISATIDYKAVGFNQVAFRLMIEPVNDDQFRNFTKDRTRRETLLHLNLRDADGFRLHDIGFTYPAKILNDEGICYGMIFEETHQVDFAVLDKVHSIDISSRGSYDD